MGQSDKVSLYDVRNSTRAIYDWSFKGEVVSICFETHDTAMWSLENNYPKQCLGLHYFITM